MNDVNMSYYRGLYDKNPVQITDLDLVNIIKNDVGVKGIIDKCRFIMKDYNDLEGDIKKEVKKEYDKVKSSLPCVTTSAMCSGGHKKENIVSLNNLLCIDIDGLTKDRVNELRKILMLWGYTFILFLSPSGYGLKLIVKVNVDMNIFENVFHFIADILKKKFDIESDQACKNPNRLCFLSNDPEVYYNPESDVIEYVEPEPSAPTPAPAIKKVSRGKIKPTAVTATAAIDVPTIVVRQLEKVEEFTSQISRFEDGNRNNYIHLFASNANRQGIDESHVEAYSQKFIDVDFTEEEIEKIIYPVYNRNQDEHSTSKANIPKHDFKSIAEEASISDDVFQNLPSKIYELVNYFSGQTRDVVLLSLLASLSGAMYWIRGWLSDYVIYPNLFAMQIGNAGSGKGAAQHSMDVLKKIEECFNDS